MSAFKELPTSYTASGKPRRAGFELEFSGLSLDAAVKAVQDILGADPVEATAAECTLRAEGLGDFKVEIDWAFLKRVSREYAADEEQYWVEPLNDLASTLVPIELVAPPIAVQELDVLKEISDALRAAGAQGTEESLIAAYGVHINTEIPALDADTLGRYIQAFCLLQWWLVDAHDVNPARKISPYIDLYPQSYVETVLARESMTLDEIFEDYLEHNPTRNRALDLLPILAEIDSERVQRTVDDDRVNARPAFHYRMPNCHIERDDWDLTAPWDLWLTVERLADRPGDLRTLAKEYLDARRMLLSVDRSKWVTRMDEWLNDHALL
ncbi:amidoligase family protein [Congregibacter litoralis]|uniref:Putative amidoligase enzyme n=1 Tax=Congregibacter litoralis KT71 TaxID=314285 RepID=A4A8R3_9GAMM|nr:amidoligase family protein [Congregibacter litoralis]EAQ97455.1 putative amidoligase enzyme [Congregibacter litoralis KT71]